MHLLGVKEFKDKLDKKYPTPKYNHGNGTKYLFTY